MLKVNQIMLALSGLAVLLLASGGGSDWNYALIAATMVFVSAGLWTIAGLSRMNKAILVRQEEAYCRD